MVEGEEGMRGKRKRFVFIAVLTAVAAFVLFRYVLVSDVERIKRTIYTGKEAIEQEDLEEAMAQVSRYYTDDYGLNYLAIRAIMTRILKEFDDIDIHVEKIEVEIVEKRVGRAELLTWVTARGSEGTRYIVGGSQEPCRVVFTLEKDKRRWRVIKVEGVDPEEVFL